MHLLQEFHLPTRDALLVECIVQRISLPFATVLLASDLITSSNVYIILGPNISIKRYLQQTLIISGHIQITYDLT